MAKQQTSCLAFFVSYRSPPNGETPGANGFCADALLQRWPSSFQAAQRQFMDLIVPGLPTHQWVTSSDFVRNAPIQQNFQALSYLSIFQSIYHDYSIDLNLSYFLPKTSEVFEVLTLIPYF